MEDRTLCFDDGLKGVLMMIDGSNESTFDGLYILQETCRHLVSLAALAKSHTDL